jgi:hypothetical protein
MHSETLSEDNGRYILIVWANDDAYAHAGQSWPLENQKGPPNSSVS